MIQQTFNPPAGAHLSPRRPADWATQIVGNVIIATGINLSISKDGGATWEEIDLTPSPESLANWFTPVITNITISPIGPASHYLTN